jgi:hypothetical protein
MKCAVSLSIKRAGGGQGLAVPPASVAHIADILQKITASQTVNVRALSADIPKMRISRVRSDRPLKQEPTEMIQTSVSTQ